MHFLTSESPHRAVRRGGGVRKLPVLGQFHWGGCRVVDRRKNTILPWIIYPVVVPRSTPKTRTLSLQLQQAPLVAPILSLPPNLAVCPYRLSVAPFPDPTTLSCTTTYAPVRRRPRPHGILKHPPRLSTSHDIKNTQPTVAPRYSVGRQHGGHPDPPVRCHCGRRRGLRDHRHCLSQLDHRLPHVP